MIRVLLTAFFVSSVSAITPATAQPPEVMASLSNSHKLGEATATFATLKIYDAELFVPGSKKFSFENSFALTLRYHRNFSGSLLASASLREMARLDASSVGKFEALRAPLQKCFGDVNKGDRITGVSKTADTATFYRNGRKTCDVSFPNFRKQFFGIWLGPKTRDQVGSARLKGQG